MEPLSNQLREKLLEQQLRRAPTEATAEIARLRAFLAAPRTSFDGGSRDLVMGFAAGYEPEVVRPFIESLVKSAEFGGQTILFIRPGDLELATYLHDRGVRTEFSATDTTSYQSLMIARWLSYWNFLTARLEEGVTYRNILLTDVRDVIFQKRLFEQPAGEIEFHLEADSPRIGQCQGNSAWVRGTFGDEVLALLAERRISCAGVVTGRSSGVLRYLAWMRLLILCLSEHARLSAVDQAIHNFILYSGLLEDACVLENFRRVATLHHVPPAQIRMNDEATLLGPDGSVCEIVHQWDRHPAFADHVVAKAKVRFLGELALIQQIARLETAADAQRHDIKSLREWITVLRAAVDARRQEADEQQRKMEEQWEELENLRRQMTDVFDSTSWKFIRRVQRLVEGHARLQMALRWTAYFGRSIFTGRNRD